MSTRSCPLCRANNASELCRDRARPYFQCPTCALIFVPTVFHLPTDEERRRYEFHENNPHDGAYRTFLMKLGEPLMKKLQPGMHGLDYGSGPGPALSVIFSERGFPMAIYDPFFADDPAVLEETYDFLTCTETVEHFRNPARHWEEMVRLIKPGGWIGVMTSLVTHETDFSTWHYARDDTHIAFYSAETLRWIAEHFGLDFSMVGDSVILMRKLG